MYFLKNRATNIKNFEISNKNNLYSVTGDKARERSVFFKEKKIIDKTRIYSLRSINKGTFINFKDGAFLYNEGEEIKRFNNKVFKGELNNGFVFENEINGISHLIYFKDEVGDLDLGKSSSILFFAQTSAYKVIFDENLVLISLVRFDTENFMWEYSFVDLGCDFCDELRVKRILGELNDELWVALNNHTVIALDVETGQLRKQLSSISDFKCDWLPSAIPAPEAMQIDKKRGCLVGLMWEFYWEINPDSGEITFYDLTEYFEEQKIRNDKPEYVLGDNHIYFISRHDSKLGALNLDTKKLDWIHGFEENENGAIPEILEIKGNDSLLGVLDRSHTLHIFESEK